MAPVGPRWASCWRHEPCYLGKEPDYPPWKAHYIIKFITVHIDASLSLQTPKGDHDLFNIDIDTGYSHQLISTFIRF